MSDKRGHESDSVHLKILKFFCQRKVLDFLKWTMTREYMFPSLRTRGSH